MSEYILVVDDDPRICRLLARFLSREGYVVETANDGSEMRRVLARLPIDLIVLDLMMPGEDGLSLARALRAESDIALIMLTGKDTEVDKIVGLELGADDYITKPFNERELLARIRSVMRRSKSASGEPNPEKASVARFAGWQLDLSARDLKSPAGELVPLTTYEFQLLSALVRRPKRALTRDQILDLVANREWAPFDRSVDALIVKLRRKLMDDPRTPAMIKTIRGTGYMFAVQVEFD